MTDILTLRQRSKQMALIRGKDTKPEIIVRKYLFSKGLRYRIHNKKLSGKPDIVLKKYKTVVFVNGCFWHGHDECKYSHLPKSNEFFWEQKIRRNKARDIANEYVLQTEGWRVIRVWECEIKKSPMREERLEALYNQIVDSNSFYNFEENPNSMAAEPEEGYN